MNDQQKLDRAVKVDKLLSDPLLTEAFDNVRQAIFNTIEQTPIRDVEGLTSLRLSLKLLQDVRANLKQVLNDGKVAEFRIEQQKREAKLRDFKVR